MKHAMKTLRFFSGRTRTVALLFAVLFAGLPGSVCTPSLCQASQYSLHANAQQKKTEVSCLSAREAELIWLVNHDREYRGLEPLQVSRSLAKVARAHALDLQQSRPDMSKYVLGMGCNLHSWSSRGDWVGGCYTSDHSHAEIMKNKPREITGNAYNGDGFEAVYWISESPVVPFMALQSWLRSADHRNLLFETGKWTGMNFKVIGIGISDNFATLWMGTLPDPLGTLPECGYGQR